ncbi:heterokaryon incompatibility protein-domain-containing protein [Usnea florida]
MNFTNHTPTLRVIETSSQLPDIRYYMTLSYCWGNCLFPTLRINNEQRLKDGIPFETLPKAFQDAIYIAEWFQIDYLWIDSLCIVQDSHDDWIRESCKMKDIYRNSVLTVAASRATDPSKGCFTDRNLEFVEPIKVCVSNETKEYMAMIDSHSLEQAIHDSPLSKRAWAFQERLLSSRVLHFGNNQMLWECNEMFACETCPGGFQSEMQEVSSSAAKGQLMSGHADFLYDFWRPIVKSYSKGALTKFSDKCLAISGIAEEAQSLYGGKYIAGLWRENIACQLLWEVLNPDRDRLFPHKRPRTYVAPSWSWLSVDGPIIFGHEGLRYNFLEKVDIRVKLLNKNPFGTIKSGWIKARGWLTTVQWRVEPGQYGQLVTIGDDWTHTNSLVSMDTAEEMDEGHTRLTVCLPVASDVHPSHSAELYGLLLTPTGAKKHEYRRIGMFGMARFERLLFQQMQENGKWIDRPKTSFTIV